MRSAASVQGHPVHPMLIGFPIAFFVGAFASDLVSRATGSFDWYFVGYVLTVAGFCMGLVAAIPGLIDYFKTIPNRSTAKRDASIHMTLNVTVVVLYIVSWLIKNATGAPPSWASIILEFIGCSMLVYSGWLGWTLVYRHRIGVSGDAEREIPVRKSA